MARRFYSSTAARTTLAAGVDGSQTTMSVTAVSGWPTSFPYTLVIDQDTVNEELVEVTGRTGTTITVTRGIDGTSGTSHDAGAVVQHGVSARDFDEPNAFINGTGTVTETLLASNAVTSAKILDGTIVNADINASAAIAQSKIANLTSDLASKVDYATPVNTQTGVSYTFVGDDAFRLTTSNSASAVTFTIPAASAVAWEDDTILRVVNYGAGALTVAGGSGVTVTNTATTLAQYESGAAIRTGSDAWTLVPFSGGVGNADFSDSATGTYTDSGIDYKYITYTASGTLTVTKAGFADILVVGGGGGGGGGVTSGGGGGGGGAGGYLEIANAYLPSGALTVVVGAGGAAGVAGANQLGGLNGLASRIGSYYGVGGGGGAAARLVNGFNGGSGGGSWSTAGAGTSGQGNDGGTGTVAAGGNGGGGGASAVGASTTTSAGANGGAGSSNSYTGAAVTRAGGGGGGRWNTGAAGSGGAGGGGNAGTGTTAGTAGTANTGGGGGAGSGQTTNQGAGGAGGSGIVIVRVKV